MNILDSFRFRNFNRKTNAVSGVEVIESYDKTTYRVRLGTAGRTYDMLEQHQRLGNVERYTRSDPKSSA